MAHRAPGIMRQVGTLLAERPIESGGSVERLTVGRVRISAQQSDSEIAAAVAQSVRVAVGEAGR